MYLYQRQQDTCISSHNGMEGWHEESELATVVPILGWGTRSVLMWPWSHGQGTGCIMGIVCVGTSQDKGVIGLQMQRINTFFLVPLMSGPWRRVQRNLGRCNLSSDFNFVLSV